MADLDAGWKPLSLTVTLVEDSDFALQFNLEESASDFAAGTQLVLEFTDTAKTSFNAVVQSRSARWDIDKDFVNTLIASNAEGVRIRYKSGDADLIWFKGVVIRA